MNRRDFFTIPVEAASSTQIQPVKRDISIVSSPTAGYPRDYDRNSLVLIEDAHAWLGRDSLGFYAVDASCPHLGCMVVVDTNQFICPCHNSKFTLEGIVTQGPSRRWLRFLMVDLDEDGKLIIYRNRLVSPVERFIA